MPATPTQPESPPSARRSAARVFASNLHALDTLERIRSALAAEGISTLYLKGAAFLDTLYEDLSSRDMCDLDILVRRSDRAAAIAILCREGVRPAHAPRGRRFSYSRHYNHQFFVGAGDALKLELHTEVAQEKRYRIPYADLWERAVEYRCADRLIPTLSPEDTVLTLIAQRR